MRPLQERNGVADVDVGNRRHGASVVDHDADELAPVAACEDADDVPVAEHRCRLLDCAAVNPVRPSEFVDQVDVTRTESLDLHFELVSRFRHASAKTKYRNKVR